MRFPFRTTLAQLLKRGGNRALDVSPDALTFPTYGAGVRKGKQVPRRAKNFLRWRI